MPKGLIETPLILDVGKHLQKILHRFRKRIHYGHQNTQRIHSTYENDFFEFMTHKIS